MVFILLAFLLSACSSVEKDLVGRWEIQIQDEELGEFSMVYHFSENGEIYLEQKNGDVVPFSIFFGTWSLEKDRLILQGDGKKDVFSFSCTEEELTLSREGEEDLVFHKV
ncbi:MAG: hypothetical protein IKU24_02060 [Clostridia bacterium]|nr:hypothetical protein [Clostridia bacterium]